MKDPYSKVKSPVISEKGTRLSDEENKYIFKVDRRATKIDIRRAIEQIYNVKIQSVRTSNRKGKRRRYRYKTGETRGWKKAVVVLHADYHIDLF